MQQALSVLCNNVRPRDGVRDNRHLTPKSHAEIHQQTIDALRGRVEQLKPLRQWVGLTNGERINLWREFTGWGDPSFDDENLMKAIEFKLKEKNT
jgi:hypothetical protein